MTTYLIELFATPDSTEPVTQRLVEADREATAFNFGVEGLARISRADSKTINRLGKLGIEIEDAPPANAKPRTEGGQS